MPINCKSWLLPFALSIAGKFAMAAELPSPPASEVKDRLEVNNSWSVEISNKNSIQSPVFITLRPVGNHWEISGIFKSAQKIPKSEQLEAFLASSDLQYWSNYYTNAISNCESFEMREYELHSVCSSSLSEQRSLTTAIVGMFFGGSGKQPIIYNKDKVAAVINSIRVEQAEKMLKAFESGQLPLRHASGG